MAVPGIAAAPPVVDRRRDVAQLEGQVAMLEQRYKSKYPKMMTARAALEEAKEALKRTALAQPAVLRNALEQAQTAERNLEIQFGEQEKSALALNKAAIVIRNWPVRPKPIAPYTKAFCARSRTQT